MKTLLGIATTAALVLGFSPTSIAGGVTVGPHTPVYVNNGTISGGSSPGITATGLPGSPAPTIINNGTITSNTVGVSVSGGSSSTVINKGTISATGSTTNGSANATGVSQTSGP